MLEDPSGLAFSVRVPAAPIITAALDVFVSRARDLVVSTPDAADGLLVALERDAGRDHYELVAWGAFSVDEGR